MQQYQYTKYGDSSVLEKVAAEKPVATGDQVLIRVAAMGVNPVDYKLRRGYIPIWPQEFPMVPGWDAAGEVVEAAQGFAKGEKVFAYTRAAFDLAAEHPSAAGEKIGVFDGTSREYIAVPAWKVARAPAKAPSQAHAAGVPLAGLTAYQGLHRHLALAAGKTVLILGASGGVGSFAVGIAKAAGLTVIGTCSARNADYVKALGADRVIDYTKGPLVEQLGDERVDGVFDLAGGDSSLEGLDVLADGAVLVSIAHPGIEPKAEAKGKVAKSFLVEPSSAELATLAGLLDEGKIQYPAVTTHPFDDIAKVHDLLESRRAQGKHVLVF